MSNQQPTASPPSIKGMRVLLGPIDVASFPTRLARALAEQGAECWVVDLTPHHYLASVDKLGQAKRWGPRYTQLVATLLAKEGVARKIGVRLKKLGQYLVFFWALVRIDAFVFVSTQSLLPGYRDLRIYKLLGKRVVRVFLGSDSRPRYMTGWHQALTDTGADPADETSQAEATHQLAKQIRRQHAEVQHISRWADIVVDNPLCGHYQTSPFINWFHVGFPHDPAFFKPNSASNQEDAGPPTPAPPSSHVTHILHSPSNPALKGTTQIEVVIQKLKDEGLPIRYTRITGMPHAHVLEHIQQCDLVIDELYSDSPMGGFASEATAYGKPVIVGGYGWAQLQQRLGKHMPPNLICDVDSFEQTLRHAINHPEQAKKVGEQAYAFINSYWRHDQVASRFAALLTGENIDEAWWVDPTTINYWEGLGATKDHRRQVIDALVKQHGLGALVLRHADFFD